MHAGLVRLEPVANLASNEVLTRLAEIRSYRAAKGLYVSTSGTAPGRRRIDRFLKDDLIPVCHFADEYRDTVPIVYQNAVATLPAPEGLYLDGTLEQTIVLLYYASERDKGLLERSLRGTPVQRCASGVPGTPSREWSWTAGVFAFGEIATRVRTSLVGPRLVHASRLARFTAGLAEILFKNRAISFSREPYFIVLRAYLCRAMLDLADEGAELLSDTGYSAYSPARWTRRLRDVTTHVHSLTRESRFTELARHYASNSTVSRREVRQTMQTLGMEFGLTTVAGAVVSKEIPFDRISMLVEEHERHRTDVMQGEGSGSDDFERLRRLMAENDRALNEVVEETRRFQQEHHELAEAIPSGTSP